MHPMKESNKSSLHTIFHRYVRVLGNNETGQEHEGNPEESKKITDECQKTEISDKKSSWVESLEGMSERFNLSKYSQNSNTKRKLTSGYSIKCISFFQPTMPSLKSC